MKSSIRYFMTEIVVTDLRHSVTWYRDVLKLQVVLDDAAGSFTLLAAEEGHARVALKGGANVQGDRSAVRLVFEVAQLDPFLLDLARRGVAFDGPISSAEGYREIKLVDPDGTPVGLFEWVREG